MCVEGICVLCLTLGPLELVYHGSGLFLSSGVSRRHILTWLDQIDCFHVVRLVGGAASVFLTIHLFPLKVYHFKCHVSNLVSLISLAHMPKLVSVSGPGGFLQQGQWASD